MHLSNILTQGLLWSLASAVSIPKELLVKRDAVNCVTTPKSPKPRGTRCGDQGTILMPGDNLIGSGSAASQEVCREQCFKKQRCVVFGWEASTSTCSFYKKSLKKMGFSKSSSGVTYWHKTCYMRSCTCPEGETKCQGNCFDLNNDASNCGSCGNQCPGDQICMSGNCACSNNGDQFCGGSCIDPSTDNNNCGSCGNTCNFEQTCSSGACLCPPTKDLCAGSCVNYMIDNNNCGSCGNTCSSTEQCTLGSCQSLCPSTAPPIALNDPITIVGDSRDGNGAPQNVDDAMFAVSLPFPIQFYGVSTTEIGVSSNGFISLNPTQQELNAGADHNSLNTALPTYNVDCSRTTSKLCSKEDILPLFGDLMIYAGTPQGLYYQITGTQGRRKVTFEWYTSHFGHPEQYYHFLATLYEAEPDTVRYDYLQISDSGVTSTVGAQSQSSNTFSQYSFNQPIITNGLSLVFDKDANQFNIAGTVVVPQVAIKGTGRDLIGVVADGVVG